MKLKTRILVSYIALFTLLIALFSFLSYLTTSGVFIQREQENLLNMAQLLADEGRIVLQQNNNDYNSLRPLLEKYNNGYFRDINSSGYAYLLDTSGRALIHPSHEGEDMGNEGFVKKIISQKTGFIDYRFGGIDKISAFHLLNGTPYIIVVTGPKKDIYFPVTKMLQNMLILSFVLLGIAVILANLMSSFFIGPINKLIKCLDDVKKGNYDKIPELSHAEEMRRLSHSFNEMVMPLKWDSVYRRILGILSSKNDDRDVCKSVVELLVGEGMILAGKVYKYDQRTSRLFDLTSEAEDSIAPGEGLVGQVAVLRQPQVIDDIKEEQIYDAGLLKIKPSAVAAFPVLHGSTFLGVLCVVSLGEFKKTEYSFFSRLASQLGIALDNIRYVNGIREMADKLKAKNSELYRQKSLHQSILRCMGDGVCVIDKDRKIIEWSMGAERITGLSRAEAIGKQCDEVIRHRDEKGCLACGTSTCVAGYGSNLDEVTEDETKVLELFVSHKDGRLIPIAMTVSPLWGEKRNHEGVIQVFRDITKEMENLKQIQQASRAKTEFLATISHEFKTPLNAILGFTEILLGDDADRCPEDKRIHYLENIRESGRHLLSLVRDVLDLSRIEYGETEWQKEELSINEVINSCLNVLKQKMAENGLTLQSELPAGNVTVVSDARKIKQILYNLLSNAIKFTPRGGKVGVRAAVKDRIILEVWDTGIGIPEDKQQWIFEPFTRVDGSLSRRHEGTGLGLDIVKRLVELGGGLIKLHSEIGKGSTFTVELPLLGSRPALLREGMERLEKVSGQ